MSQHYGNQTPPLSERSDHPDVIAPDGSEIRFLINNRHFAITASMVEVTLRAGQTSKPVWHRNVEEIWYILEGSGTVWRYGPNADPTSVHEVHVSKGDSLVIPVLWRFQFGAGESEDLILLCFTVPPWPGEDEAQPSDFGGLGPPNI